MDSFCRADVDTGLTINAHILIDLCLIVLYRNGRCWTLIHAGLTSGTLIVVNDRYQLVHSTVIFGEKTKKVFRCYRTAYPLPER